MEHFATFLDRDRKYITNLFENVDFTLVHLEITSQNIDNPLPVLVQASQNLLR